MRLAIGVAVGAVAIAAAGCRAGATPETSFAEAEALRGRHEASATHEAITRYRQAQAAWRQTDKRAGARAGERIGGAFEELGSLRESYQAYQDALALAVESGDAELQSELHSAIGINQAYSADRSELLDGAERHCRTALDISRRERGTRLEAKALTCLGEVIYARGDDLELALANYRQAEQLWASIGDQYGLALAVLAQGWVSSDMRRFAEARRYFDDARSRWTSLGENRHLAITLVSDARLLQRRGDYQQALNAFEEASALLEPMGDAIWQGSSLTGQARIRFNMADVARSLELYEKALGLFEASGLKNFTVDALMSFGAALLASGDDLNALKKFERALTLAAELGTSRWQAWAHRNIGSVYQFRLEAARAREHFQKSLEFLRPLNERWLNSLVLTDLGEAEQVLGNGDRALLYFDEALAVSRSSENREEVARGLFARGALEVQQGKVGPARTSLNQALSERERLFGAAHPLVAETRAALARVDFAGGAFGPALSAAMSAEDTSRVHLRDTLRYLPERQALTFAAKRPRGLDLAISVVAAGAGGQRARVFDGVIQSRGLVLDELAARAHTIDSADPQVSALAGRMMQARQRYANLLVRSLEESVARPMLDEARQQKEQAERVLAERSAEARADLARSTIGLEAVRRALPAGSALVSFVQYERSSRPNAAATSPPPPVTSFAAFVLRAGETAPAVVPLGGVAETEQLIGSWRTEISGRSLLAGAPPAQVDRAARGAGSRLRRAIWDPVAAHLRGASRVFIVPDGALSLVPFAALPAGESAYLLEEASPIHYLSAERDLALAAMRKQISARGLLALGGPAFDADRLAASAGSSAATPAVGSILRAGSAECSDFQSLRFQPLSGTLAEVQELSNVWTSAQHSGLAGSQTLVDKQATESTFKRDAHNYRVLHLATHGFFLGGACTVAPSGTRGVGGLAGVPRRVENPLLLSGLALAGANRRATAAPDEDDGILTAEEVASLNLDGVEWAVLSACDTGVGEIKAGEGVFGLRRAFQVAGARTVVMSLWSVDDQATRAWMRALYEGRFQKGLSTADAVHGASLAVLRARRAAGQSTDPFYWAAFVAVGDWR